MLIATILICVAFFISSLYLYKCTPKDINHFAGYRTPSAKKSPKAWTLANSYFSKILFRYYSISFIIDIIVYFICKSDVIITILSISLLSIITFSAVLSTEKLLEKTFKDK